MLVVDAGCLFEIVAGTPQAEPLRERLAADQDWAAPHLVDVEVYSVIRQKHRAGRLDRTAAAQAVEDLADWPGERFAHRTFLARAWQLRDNVRGWDAIYVALAEALDAVLLTTDGRLMRAEGPRCSIEWFAPSGGDAVC
jgi:predicted nucleic acid-binding protein